MAEISNKLIFIGIDSSTTCTGVSVLYKEGKKETLLLAKKFYTTKEQLYQEKCVFFYKEIYNIYLEYKDMSPIVGIELLNSKNNMDTTRKLAGLWSFIIVSLFKDFGVKVNSINTKSAKKITTGDGSADKEKIIKYVNKYFKLKLKYNKNKDLSDDDIADSISIALSLSRLHKEGLLNDE